MVKFAIGDKVFNLNGELAEVADIVDTDDYPLYALRYENGETGVVCWEDHELKAAINCDVCSGTGQGYTGQFFFLDCIFCDGTGKIADTGDANNE